MSKLITVPNPLTNSQRIWANKEEANAFFESFYVASATTSDEGVVKKASNVTYTYSSPTGDYYTIPGLDGDGNQVALTVPTWARHQSLEAQVAALGVAVAAILTSLKTAGSMANA